MRRQQGWRRALVHLGGVGVLACGACASSPVVGRTAIPDTVTNLEVPFAVRPPLTSQDGREIAGAIRPMMSSSERVYTVEVVPCTVASCIGGIRQRAEAWVLEASSDMADIVLLCKGSGRWIASRPTAAEWRNPNCPDVR